MEKKISADNLFHFTPKSEYLESIVINGFYPRYCLESMPFESKIKGAFPMVCFCDIPFYLQSDHINRYGNYGVGMSMEWGIKNGLSPLIYSDENSKSSKLLLDLFKLPEVLGIEKDNLKTNSLLNAVAKLSAFYKPYLGFEDGHSKKFYNEREWRYLPEFNESQKGFFLTEQEFNNQKIRDHNNQMILEINNAILKYEICDVEYLIFPNENEKDLFFNKLFNSVSNRTTDELNQLTTKEIVYSEKLIK
jgi:hypothetical protein